MKRFLANVIQHEPHLEGLNFIHILHNHQLQLSTQQRTRTRTGLSIEHQRRTLNIQLQLCMRSIPSLPSIQALFRAARPQKVERMFSVMVLHVACAAIVGGGEY